MATNRYTVNGGLAQTIDFGYVEIDLSTDVNVKAGCRGYPIPLLNKITVTSTEDELSSSKPIYAGYKVVNQLLGAILPNRSYNPEKPNLNTIILSGRFGMFEPAHYSSSGWITNNMDPSQINSLINVGAGVKICVKIEYTKFGGSPAVVYVHIDRADTRFFDYPDTNVPRYSEIGVSALNNAETVENQDVQGYNRRTWFESVLSADILNVDLSTYITNPDTSLGITVTLMAFIGSTIPTADNTFPILRKDAQSSTSISCQFETYNPTITINNKDITNNPDDYDDGYGSVADYDATTNDTKIIVSILAPQ